MPRSYWGISLTLVGWLALAGATPPHEKRPAADAKQQVKDSATPVGNYAAYPDKYADSCYEDKDHEAADLCAQWRAAIAAEKAARASQGANGLVYWGNWIAGLGALLSFVSVVLIVWTLCETRRSNRISMKEYARARIEARKAIKHADDSLRETQQANALLLRPYLFIVGDEELEPKPFAREEKIPFSFKNFGQTPALDVKIQINSEVVSRPIGDYEITLSEPQGCYGKIAPGALIRDSLGNDLPLEAIARIAAGEVLITRLRLSYSLPSGGTDSHDVTWFLDRDGLATTDFNQVTAEQRKRTE